MAGRDDEALTWEGDDDPTLEVASRSVEPPSLPEGWSAVGRGSDAVEPEPGPAHNASADGASTHPDPASAAPATTDTTGDARPALGNAALIATGVLGGIYLIYAIGWLIGGLRLQGLRTYLVTDVMYVGSLWLATLAPLLWFATVWLTTRRSATWVRFVWLAGGLLLLLPWPFVLVGAVGQ